MKEFTVSYVVSGIADFTVHAETEEEAERIATSMMEGVDFNGLYCVDAEVCRIEEEGGNH